jgi:hypothetical protein
MPADAIAGKASKGPPSTIGEWPRRVTCRNVEQSPAQGLHTVRWVSIGWCPPVGVGPAPVGTAGLRVPLAGRLSIGRASPGKQPSRASPLNRPQEELGANRLDPVAAQVLVPLDRVTHVPRQPLAGAGQRGQYPTEPGTADAELGLDVSLELLVGHLGRMTAQDDQDLDGAAGVSRATNRSARLAVIPPGFTDGPVQAERDPPDQ